MLSRWDDDGDCFQFAEPVDLRLKLPGVPAFLWEPRVVSPIRLCLGSMSMRLRITSPFRVRKNASFGAHPSRSLSACEHGCNSERTGDRRFLGYLRERCF